MATGMKERPGWLGTDGMRQEKGEGLLYMEFFFFPCGQWGTHDSCSKGVVRLHLCFRALWLAAVDRKD